MNPAALTIAEALRHASRECDLCGEDQAELRLWGDSSFATDTLCRQCLTQRDGEHDFTDFPLVKGATNAAP